MVLHWICLTMLAYSLQKFFEIIPAVCPCYLSHELDHLLTSLKNLKEAQMVWPSTKQAIHPLSEVAEKKKSNVDKMLWVH